ncbi:MAG: peptide ABC transporter substrate-binding protein, partial [Woeseiaceae bacterium]
WNDANTAIDLVRHHVVTEPTTELNRYRAGELDITTNVPPEAFATLKVQRPDELRVAPSLGVYYYGFNLTKPPFQSNLQLRAALSMAIDREELAEKIIRRGEAPAYSWVPPGVENYEPIRFYYADLSPDERHTLAQRLYREAGYDAGNPAQIELRYNTADITERIALAVQSMWRETLGFNAKLVNEEFQVLLSNIRAMEVTQVFRSSWLGDYNDANAFLYLFHSDSPANLFGYRSDEVDQLLQQAAEQTDPMHRRVFLEEVERVVLADHPVIPIYFFVSKRLVSPRVVGWEDNVLDYHYSRHLSLVVDPEG